VVMDLDFIGDERMANLDTAPVSSVASFDEFNAIFYQTSFDLTAKFQFVKSHFPTKIIY
jgi:hypothetical protein